MQLLLNNQFSNFHDLLSPKEIFTLIRCNKDWYRTQSNSDFFKKIIESAGLDTQKIKNYSSYIYKEIENYDANLIISFIYRIIFHYPDHAMHLLRTSRYLKVCESFDFHCAKFRFTRLRFRHYVEDDEQAFQVFNKISQEDRAYDQSLFFKSALQAERRIHHFSNEIAMQIFQKAVVSNHKKYSESCFYQILLHLNYPDLHALSDEEMFSMAEKIDQTFGYLVKGMMKYEGRTDKITDQEAYKLSKLCGNNEKLSFRFRLIAQLYANIFEYNELQKSQTPNDQEKCVAISRKFNNLRVDPEMIPFYITKAKLFLAIMCYRRQTRLISGIIASEYLQDVVTSPLKKDKQMAEEFISLFRTRLDGIKVIKVTTPQLKK